MSAGSDRMPHGVVGGVGGVTKQQPSSATDTFLFPSHTHAESPRPPEWSSAEADDVITALLVLATGQLHAKVEC